ncbi:MAG: L-seryl-tRNA(Sec) selenium transferase [Armatimonadota bacterium]|nr:MAG: L-seryl-tRNA(Sec) selenium transferase [Armatimonadota bacterium]
METQSTENNRSGLRQLPAVSRVLQDKRVQEAIAEHGRELVVDCVRETLVRLRERLKAGEPVPTDLSSVVQEALRATERWRTLTLRRVINATGVVLHTGLGRAVLAEAACKAVAEVAQGHSMLEIDRETGERGDRIDHIRELLCRLTGAEDATVVNNNAGAVLLAVTVLAQGKEVIISRGQLVEIGGAFRMPDIIAQSGAKLVEVGTTNRTRLSDYERAITSETALLLRCHPSNFRIVGFTEEVSAGDLALLAHKYNLPVLDDVGSGCLAATEQFGLEHEPTLQESVQAGCDVVTCSGDKLLGGPQAGIILGRREIVQRIRRHPLHRALRVDKLTLAALEATLRLYLNPQEAVREIPVLRALAMSAEQIRRRARRLKQSLQAVLPAEKVAVRLREGMSAVGGGSLPGQQLPTTLVCLRPLQINAQQLARALRWQEPAVFARIEQNEVVIDPRTLLDDELDLLVQAATRAMTGCSGGETDHA